ncbi:MAG TPA: cupin domain-containing protein [Candidatus Paceibacterota bacterium]|nr:cupin domain-containing protein [Candidatus Paceibacterota bacterium]
MQDEKKPVVEFLTPEVWERPWGEEVLLIHTDLYTGKLLKYKKGSRGGLQFHRLKDEAGYILSGRLLVEWDPGDGTIVSRELGPGEALHIPPGAVHRETALEDLVIFEVSNPVFNDRVRSEERYGEMIPEGGLPTTTLDQVEVGFPRQPYKA